MATSVASLRRRQIHKVNAALVLAAMLVIFAGFAPTYFLNAFFAQRVLPWVLHLHGFIFSAWFVLLLVQILLVANGRTDLHRRLGVAGFGLACIMVPLGLWVGIHAAKYGSLSTPPGINPLSFLAIPFGDIVVFATLVTAGLLYRRRPEFHKRLMMLSALSMLAPAVGRLPLAFIQTHGLPAVFGIADLLVLAFIAYDTISHKRLHPANLWGGLLILISAPARLAISGTTAWLAFAHWLTHWA